MRVESQQIYATEQHSPASAHQLLLGFRPLGYARIHPCCREPLLLEGYYGAMHWIWTGIAICLGLLGTPRPSAAELDFVPLSSQEVVKRWHARMDGQRFIAQVRMDVDLAGFKENRHMTVYRDHLDATQERVLIRFDAPPSLRRMALLYLEQPHRSNDYFLYRPSVRRVRRLHESTVSGNIYGIDPEFLGFGIAESVPTEVVSMERTRIHDRDAYLIREKAIDKNRRFDKRNVWIDAETFMPLKTEHQLNDELVLSANTVRIETLHDVPTPVEMKFLRPKDRTTVDLYIENVKYDATIPEDVFSIFTMTRQRVVGTDD